ncbi:cytochrome c [Algoriphagus sp. 4150]|uniref:c-type cytochrome n=1 Tax=Algoriphagus sp. 4150 TaxID=2817756 RepID=UPI0028629FAC|nr:c-type cytochrome [Algoriphagus sp. 4150]MDR7130195.1 cytochrome c [Algoriphagus sp. 4150]
MINLLNGFRFIEIYRLDINNNRMKITNLSKSAIVVLAIAFFSCGGGGNSAEEEVVMATTPKSVQKPATADPKPTEEVVEGGESVAASGKVKMENSDCMSCHMMDRKVIGPSFLEIAAEYQNNEENVAKLAGKVINGGAGVWGEAAMAPHPSLSEEDAKDMVSYILSL